MRNFYILICLLAVSAVANSQTFFTIDFSDNQMPPEGWTIENLESSWSVEAYDFAGGDIPEGSFSGWQTGSDNTTRLISPEIDLTGLETITFQFKEWKQDNDGGYTIGVATRSQGGAWNIEREISPSGITGPDEITLEIGNDDVGASDFQICLFVDGNTSGFGYWEFDDMVLFNQVDLDAALLTLNTDSKFYGPGLVEGVLKNFGTSVITSIQINWQVDEGEITTSNFDGLSINAGETYDFMCDGNIILPPAGGYNLKVWIETVNGVEDENPTNDMLEETIDVASHSIYHKPCIEEFSHSSCGPCAVFNAAFFPWLEEHDEEATFLKYPTCWNGPATGDPYCTEEVEYIVDLYDVGGVPTAFVDGAYVISFLDNIQNSFDQAILKQGFVKISGTRSTVSDDNTEMEVEISLLPFVKLDQAQIRVIIFEDITTGNTGNNGETEFHHILMKMIPDEMGIITNLQDREPFVISETVELEGTHIEEWDDLGIIVFVQDVNTKNIWQSEYIFENTTLSTDASLMDLKVDGVSIDGFSPEILEYTIVLPSGTTEVPLVEAFASDDQSTAIVVPTLELPGVTTIDVFAEDPAYSNTYKVTFEIGTGNSSEISSAVHIYPNPGPGQFRISGIDNSRITVCDITGAEIVSIENFSTGLLDLSDQKKGVYLLKIHSNKKTITRKLVIE